MLSNTAVPKYYGEFRNRVLSGEIPINKEIEMEMNRIDELIKNPNIYPNTPIIIGTFRNMFMHLLSSLK